MSIDLGFLEEYENREYDSFKKSISLSKRIGELQSPSTYIVDEKTSFWSQVAFSGTIIFPLHTIPPDIFELNWNISIDQLPDFIHFAKETKKIQFILTTKPTTYKEFDYLEPILREFMPPLFTFNFNVDDEKLQEIKSTYLDEFKYLLSISPEWQNFTTSVTGLNLLGIHAKSYIWLRYLGFNDFADTFIDNFLIDPSFANTYLSIIEKLILYPLGDPLKSNLSISLDTLQIASQIGIKPSGTMKKSIFPEVGSYLMKKCTYYPESLEACKNVISQYKENDLYKVNSALNNAIIDKNDSVILQKKEELGEILDNVWKDSSIKRNATICNYGIDITCGIIGYGLGGVPGLIGSIGLEIADKTKSNYLDQFSELIAKKIAQPYMTTIFDFKKKYKI